MSIFFRENFDLTFFFVLIRIAKKHIFVISKFKKCVYRKKSFDILIIIHFKFKLRSLRRRIFRRSFLFFEIDTKFEINVNFID